MEFVCIVCPNSCKLTIVDGEVSGNKCPRGKKFALDEMTCPMRTVCTTVKTVFADRPVLPVRTSADIPKSKMAELMKIANAVVLDRRVKRGEIIVGKLFGSDVNLISTSDMTE